MSGIEVFYQVGLQIVLLLLTLTETATVGGLDSEGGGGITYSNTWPLEIPYDGFYGIKGTADNAGRILIDGQEVYKLKGFKNQSPKIEKVKLTQGKHNIKVEVENFRQENSIIIKKKIFSTQDWAKKLAAGGSVDVNFKITSSADFANTVEMKEVFSFGKSYKGAQINESTSKTLESGKVYDVIFNSNRKGGGGGKHAKHNKRKAAALKREVKKPSNKRKAGFERDVNVFKRRKFIKNNHIEPDREEEDDDGETESDEEEGADRFGYVRSMPLNWADTDEEEEDNQ